MAAADADTNNPNITDELIRYMNVYVSALWVCT